MKKTPCEDIVWDILPCIRRKLAEELLNLGLKQKEVAEKIGVSSAAISQYLSNKRGKMKDFDENLTLEIQNSARKILEGSDTLLELCRICEIIKKSGSSFSSLC